MRITVIWYLEKWRELNDLRFLILQVHDLSSTWVWFTCKLLHLLISPPFAGQFWSVKIIWLGLWLLSGAGSLGSYSTVQCILKGAEYFLNDRWETQPPAMDLVSSPHHFISVPSMFRWEKKKRWKCYAARTHIHFDLECSLLVPSFHLCFKHVDS